jgi:hypothetical protein
VYDRSDRPIREYGRGDHLFSSETPVETHFGELEKERSPRPILKLIGPIYFFAVREVGGRGVTDFFGGWGYPRAFFRNCRVAMRSFLKKTGNSGELFSKSLMTLPGNF